VITLQTSVLRDEAGKLGDLGIDCQLSYIDESVGSDPSVLPGGICKIIWEGRGQHSKSNHIIPHTNVPDNSQGSEGWFMLEEDVATGIAFYAYVSATD